LLVIPVLPLTLLPVLGRNRLPACRQKRKHLTCYDASDRG
jgi:hypothetical protein